MTVSCDAEKVVMLLAKRTFAPAGFDGGLGQDDDRVHSELHSRLLGERQILFDEILLFHGASLLDFRTVTPRATVAG